MFYLSVPRITNTSRLQNAKIYIRQIRTVTAIQLMMNDDETLFIHGILSLQSGILKSRALYNILIRSTNYALI